MALPSRAARRRSFVDARHDGRQMEVSWHEDAGVLVISLWQGSTCRSTFRMPIEDAPQLIGVLSSALGDAASSRRPKIARDRLGAPSRSRLSGVADVLGRVRRMATRQRADVVPLRPKRQPGSGSSYPYDEPV